MHVPEWVGSHPEDQRDRYAHLWPKASERERRVAAMITEVTGLMCERYGLGAGDDQRIEGGNEAHGTEKGAPDIKIKDMPFYVEVTGPHVPISSRATLWIRPEKITHAERHRSDMETWVVHCINDGTDKEMIRPIYVGRRFLEDVGANRFNIHRTDYDDGAVEYYLEVPHDSDHIRTWETFINRILHYKNRATGTASSDIVQTGWLAGTRTELVGLSPAEQRAYLENESPGAGNTGRVSGSHNPDYYALVKVLFPDVATDKRWDGNKRKPKKAKGKHGQTDEIVR